MGEYLEKLREAERPEEEKKRGPLGCLAFGWAGTALLVIFAVVFVYRFGGFLRQMRSGGIVNLPQYQTRLTSTGALSSGLPTSVSGELAPPGSVSFGPSAGEAVLTVVEFGDFGCPFSRDAAASWRSAMRQYGDRVRFVYRHYPIASLHPDAVSAAEAFECAAEQGQAWAMYDKLYLNQEAQKFADLRRYADEIGLDAAAFEPCLTEGRHAARVSADLRDAAALGLEGTPSFFFNGQVVSGAIPTDVMVQIIETFLEQ